MRALFIISLMILAAIYFTWNQEWMFKSDPAPRFRGTTWPE